MPQARPVSEMDQKVKGRFFLILTTTGTWTCLSPRQTQTGCTGTMPTALSWSRRAHQICLGEVKGVPMPPLVKNEEIGVTMLGRNTVVNEVRSLLSPSCVEPGV